MITERQFIRLFVEHEGELRGYATTLMLRHAEAEDVLQDACVAMWEKIGSLEDPKAFRSWAYTFVRFTALNKIRKRGRSPVVFSENLVELMAEEGEQEAEQARAEFGALTECLEQLPAKQRDLVSRYYASARVRMADVAREIGKNVAGLYKSLERTRESLRGCIEQRLAEENFN